MTSLAAFDRKSFLAVEVAERDYLCQTLAVELTHRVREARDFHAAVKTIVEELRAQGHPLWSFDEDDDFAIRAPDYSKPTSSASSTWAMTCW